jgi:hypothetical protein
MRAFHELGIVQFLMFDPISINEEDEACPSVSPYLPKGPRRMIINGSSGSGKTYALSKILKHLPVPWAWEIFCNGTINQAVYNSLIDYFSRQGTRIRQHTSLDDLKEAVFENPAFRQHPGCFVTIDDYSDEKDLKNKCLGDLFSKGRHAKAHCFLITQEFFHIPKGLRTNLTDICIFKITRPDIIYPALPKTYFASFSSFLDDYADATEPDNPNDPKSNRDWLHITFDATSPKWMHVRKGLCNARSSLVPYSVPNFDSSSNGTRRIPSANKSRQQPRFSEWIKSGNAVRSADSSAAGPKLLMEVNSRKRKNSVHSVQPKKRVRKCDSFVLSPSHRHVGSSN